MGVSYKKLWKLLIDKEMNRTSLQHLAGVSSASMAKLGKNENVTTETLCKICAALQCNIGDLVEFLPDSYTAKDKGEPKNMERKTPYGTKQ